MKPSIDALRQHYPKSELREVLYARIGWSDVVSHPAFQDTCAIRMSVGLIGAGVPLPGASMKVKAGPLKMKPIEPRQGNLSKILKRIWGAPEVYRGERAAQDGIGKRSGVISFFRIERGNGGHIDLIWPGMNGFHQCARSCFFSAVEIWFWPLQ